MKKRMVRMISLLLASMMLLSACGESGKQKNTEVNEDSQTESSQNVTENTENGYPEYLNLDSAYPVIKDEYVDDVKPTLAIVLDNEAKSWDELWISSYLEQKYNLYFDVEVIMGSALSERKTLIMNSGEMPDIMMNFSFSTQELVQYGMEEGMFLALDEYMNETLTPSIMNYIDTVAESCTTPDGHIYTLPLITDGAKYGGYYSRFFVNMAALEEVGISELPTTLDEFIDMLYAVKEANPECYPFGGGMSVESNTKYLLQALGYMTNNAYGLSVCLRDGKVVIPAYDVEVYKEFLRILNQFYNDGIIVENFFTITNTEVNTMVADGKTIIYDNTPELVGIDASTDALNWKSLLPLTSDWQDEAECIKPTSTSAVGGIVISADTEYPELCLRFADLYYNNETDVAKNLWDGPVYDSEWAKDENGNPDGFCHYTWDGETMAMVDLPEGYNDYSYIIEYLTGRMPGFGAYNTMAADNARSVDISGKEVDEYEQCVTVRNGRFNYAGVIEEALLPYAIDAYPSFIYLDADTSAQVADLRSVINNYAEEQIALFITGARSLDEMDVFKEELDSMGMEELLKIYTDAYNVYLTNR